MTHYIDVLDNNNIKTEQLEVLRGRFTACYSFYSYLYLLVCPSYRQSTHFTFTPSREISSAA